MAEITNERQTLEGQLRSLERRIANKIGTQTWRDLKHNQHDRAFVVAGAMKADLLNDLAQAVNDSISKGLGLDYFRKEFDAIVAKYGWQYNGSRNWRTRVIFQTNMRVSYAAGRQAQLNDPELQKLKPYRMYRHSGSENPRLQHKAWDKLALPHNHPAWKIMSAPNGWGCGCYEIAVSARDIERMGGRLSNDTPPGLDTIPEEWQYQVGASPEQELEQIAQAKTSLPSALADALSSDVDVTILRRAVINDVRAAGVARGGEIEFAGLIKDGKKQWMKQGKKNVVTFTDEERAESAGGVLVHNHPSSRSLSKEDLLFAVRNKLRSVIAVGNQSNVYEASPIASLKKLTATHKIVVSRVAVLFAQTKGLEYEDWSRWGNHLINAVLHKRGAIHYRFELDWQAPDWVRDIINRA